MEANRDGILSGTMIDHCVTKTYEISINPYNKEQLNPASYDLLLGDTVRLYTETVTIKKSNVEDGTNISKKITGLLDPKKINPTVSFKMPKSGFVLQPGIGYLLHTKERIHTDVCVPVIDGKSSLGRLFLAVHVTAGYGDPGFDGQYTLEAVATHRVVIYPGMRICQIRFHTIFGVPKPYRVTGRYTGEDAIGPVASKPFVIE